MIILRQKEYTSLPRKIGAKIAKLRVNAADRLGNKAMAILYKQNKNK